MLASSNSGISRGQTSLATQAGLGEIRPCRKIASSGHRLPRSANGRFFQILVKSGQAANGRLQTVVAFCLVELRL